MSTTERRTLDPTCSESEGAASARMNTYACPRGNHTAVSVVLARRADGLTVSGCHWHEDSTQAACDDGTYTELSYTEAIDLLLTLIDEHRPGTCAQIWGQSTLRW